MRAFNTWLALRITDITTSMWFLYGFIAFVSLWMHLAPPAGLDTSPSFPVLLTWTNLFQAIMLPILGVGQAVAQAAARQSARENEQILRNSVLVMKAVASSLEQDLRLAQDAQERLERIEGDVEPSGK